MADAQGACGHPASPFFLHIRTGLVWSVPLSLTSTRTSRWAPVLRPCLRLFSAFVAWSLMSPR